MRAFRPSLFGSLEEEESVDPVEQIVRTAKMEVYAKRAEAHQPLFQESIEPHLEVRARTNGRHGK